MVKRSWVVGMGSWGRGRWPRLALGLAVWLVLPFAAAAGKHKAVRVRGGSLLARQRGARTMLTWRPRRGAPRQLRLPMQEGIYPGSLASMEVLGTPGPDAFVVATTYSSRPNGGSHECGAGEETYVRVVSFGAPAQQTLAELLESCWQSIDDSKYEWNDKRKTLLVDVTDYSQEGAPHSRTLYSVDEAGRVGVLRQTRDTGDASSPANGHP